ncbi:MAG: M15 family metallopeptidase [Paracoccaceae bacterium]
MDEQTTNWLIPAIIVAAALILAPIIWIGLSLALSGGNSAGGGGFGGSAVDSGARIELEMMRGQVDDLRARVEDMEGQIIALGRQGSAAAARANPDEEDAILRGSGPNDIINAYAQVVLIADRLNVNKGLTVAGSRYMVEKLGLPRANLGDDCQPMTNEALKDQLVLEDVGPIRVRMLRPAAESLARVFAKVQRADPDLYARIKSSGSLCVRNIRGTTNRPSNHSFGLALDMNIDGHLDNFTDGKTQLGLTIMADFFHAEGWIWGAGFRREDSMHFEVSKELLDRWLSDGSLQGT